MYTLVEQPVKAQSSKYEGTFKEIIQALKKTDNGSSTAKKMLEKLFLKISSEKNKNRFIQDMFFISALNKRIKNISWDVPNLYLLEDNNKQLEAFNLMATQFPFVTQSQKIANTAIINKLKGYNNICIVDVGIGTGKQVIAMLDTLLKQKVLPKNITLIGIEPSATSIREASKNIEAFCFEYKMEIELILFNKSIESLNSEDWLKLNESTLNKKIAINASFSLHHTEYKYRQKIFNNLKKLNSSIFIIIEPYANYITTDLEEKFQEAWAHYSLTFKALDKINMPESSRNFVKSIFFGREIEDVFSENSVELYEKSEMWLNYLFNAGFKNLNISSIIRRMQNNNEIDIMEKDGFNSLEIEGKTVVGVICVK